MAIFPEDYEIHVTLLIQIWVAEGFIKSNEAQSLEEIAEGKFQELVDRNLIIVRRLRRSGKIKTCYIHDLLRDLCLRLAEKEKFLCIMRSFTIPRDVRRVVYHHGKKKHWFDLFFNASHSAVPLARSLITSSNRQRWFRCKLLRVLHVFGKTGRGSPFRSHFQQYNLRYISHPSHLLSRTSFSSVSFPSNLQTLIFGALLTYDFPSNLIWQMPKLRHLKIRYGFTRIHYGFTLSDPPRRQSDQQDVIVLQNLQTLELVENLKLSEEFCKRIPNLKKLKMQFDNPNADDYCLYNLDRLDKLESLYCCFFRLGTEGQGDLQKLTLPTSLKKLTLKRVKLHSEDLRMIGGLPHLEVLVIRESSVGSKWNPVEEGFCGLKFLEIEFTPLKCWNADISHFPVLETLILRFIGELREIPLGVGGIPTLRLIHLEGCCESVGVSAVRILEEQESLGNEDLQVQVDILGKHELKRFRERMEDEVGSFTSNNLHLKFDEMETDSSSTE